MATTTLHTVSPQLQPLAQRMKVWRATRTRGQRIPKELWIAATELARVHGLNHTAATLKLNYYGLQRRLSSGPLQRKLRVPPPAFVELAAPSLPTNLDDHGTLELVQASGARLTLRLPNASLKDLLPVVQLFLRQRP
jgi:hypothetical protein